MKIALFVAFWVVLIAGLVVLAVRWERQRSKVTGAGSAGPPGFWVAVILALLGLGVATPALAVVLTTDAQRRAPDVPLTDAQRDGRTLFAVSCANCHTLEAAHAVGRAGPDLDRLRPPAVLVLDAVEHGRARGNGRMPSGLLSDREARSVADFVVAVAGR